MLDAILAILAAGAAAFGVVLIVVSQYVTHEAEGLLLLVVAAVLVVGAAVSYHLRKLREEIRGRWPAGGAGARGRRDWPAEWLDGSANRD